jgi:hypothetical protein
VSAFAAGAGVVLGQRAKEEKSNEIRTIPELLSPGACSPSATRPPSLRRSKNAEPILSWPSRTTSLAESIEDFWRSFRAHPPSILRPPFPRPWRRITAASRRAAAMSSASSTASINQASGRACAHLP